MVEILVDGQALELDDLTKIKYTAQISDIFDIAKVKASYTNSFSVPKTYKNVRLFNSLGLVGSESNIPYEKVSATIKENGFDVVRNGWLRVVETSDKYKINIIDGAIDFFKEIENKTMGGFLDFSEIDHIKNIDTVIASFTNENYRYIVANYGGKTIYDGKINIDYLTPSARIKYLWDKIFNTFGWTYSGSIFSNEDFLNSWMTYPGTDEDELLELVFSGTKNNFTEYDPVPGFPWNGFYPGYYWFNNQKQWDSYTEDATNVEVLNQWTVKITQTGKYRINARTLGKCVKFPVFNSPMYFAVRYKGTVEIFPTTIGEEFTFEYEGIFQAEDEIFIGYCSPFSESAYALVHTQTELKVYKSTGTTISFTDNLFDYQIKDFIKEQIIRFGLTPDVNTENRHITFYTQAEKLNLDNAVDWSNKFVTRKKETYIYGSYAQENFFRHKYNDSEDYFSDGIIPVNNENLDDSKTLFTSKTYSKELELFQFIQLLGIMTFTYPFYEPEAVEGEDGVEVKFKGLKNRFYILKSNSLPSVWAGIFISEKTGQQGLGYSVPMAKATDTHFNELVNKYYAHYIGLLNGARVHEIELVLNILDVVNLDLMKVYYFEQEGAYYVLNKLTWESGKTCIGEFVKIKR